MRTLSSAEREEMLDIVLEGEKGCVENDFYNDAERVTNMLLNQPSEFRLVGGRFPTLLGSRASRPLYAQAGVRPSSESVRL